MFLHAAKLGEAALLKDILDTEEMNSKLNVNCVDYMGRNALFLAVDTEIIEAIEVRSGHRLGHAKVIFHLIPTNAKPPNHSYDVIILIRQDHIIQTIFHVASMNYTMLRLVVRCINPLQSV